MASAENGSRKKTAASRAKKNKPKNPKKTAR
jgi:hypothetical protein